MKPRFLIVLIAGLSALCPLRAEPKEDAAKADAFVTSAARDLRSAALFLSFQAEDNPQLATQIVAAALAAEALKDQSLEIVEQIMKTVPKRRLEILRAAILARPAFAVLFTELALTLSPPAQAAEIVKVATEAAPKEFHAAIAALPDKVVRFDDAPSQAQPVPPAANPFPLQPVRPDLVSPSSGVRSGVGSVPPGTPPPPTAANPGVVKPAG